MTTTFLVCLTGVILCFSTPLVIAEEGNASSGKGVDVPNDLLIAEKVSPSQTELKPNYRFWHLPKQQKKKIRVLPGSPQAKKPKKNMAHTNTVKSNAQ